MSYEDIMYAAAIIEKVARETKNTRKVIAEYVGISNINHLAEYRSEERRVGKEC